MRFQFKKMTLVITVLLCMVALFGCSSNTKPVATKDYSNKLNTYKISVPGEWVASQSANEDNITLDNADKSLTVTIQKFPKDLPNMKIVKNLDIFIPAYEKTAIANLLAIGEVSKLEKVSIDGAKDARAYEIKASKDGVVAKAYITYIETEKGFYSATITGIEEKYDKDIASLKEAIKTIKETK